MPCSCENSAPSPKAPMSRPRFFMLVTFFLALWCGLYFNLETLANWAAFGLFGLAPGSKTGEALAFFCYDTPKILLLLALMIYLIAWFRAGLRVERVRTVLSGKGRIVGYALGAVFGAVTPFCSCSSIPIFLGFTTAGIPLGVTMGFLITSPIINELAVVLLWGLLGWKFTLCYVAVGLVAGMAGGAVMDALKAERWLQSYVLESAKKRLKPLGLPMANVQTGPPAPGFAERHVFALNETRSIFNKVWLWVIAGVALGAFLHGLVPDAWFAAHLGAGQWWSVPVAVALGVPLYANVSGIVPVMQSLLAKGLPVGTTLAFCMSAVAASLPELLMLKQIMRWQLLALFLAVLLVLFTLVGWVFNSLSGLFLNALAHP